MSENNQQNETPENNGPNLELDQQLSDIDALIGDFSPDSSEQASQGNAASQPVDVDTVAMCSSLITVLFAIMASRRGEHWALSDKESEQLGGAVAAVLDKYAPEFQGGPEATLILVSLIIVGPRAMADVQVKREAARTVTSGGKEKGNGQDSGKAAPEADAGPGWIQDAA